MAYGSGVVKVYVVLWYIFENAVYDNDPVLIPSNLNVEYCFRDIGIEVMRQSCRKSVKSETNVLSVFDEMSKTDKSISKTGDEPLHRVAQKWYYVLYTP